jgi:prophage antirepressor-like protein
MSIIPSDGTPAEFFTVTFPLSGAEFLATRHDNRLLLLGKDVTDYLELGNGRSSIAKLRPEHRVTVHLMDGAVTSGNVGPNRNRIFLTERGVYRLVMRSDKPEAEDFQEWLAGVAEEINHTGRYATPAVELAVPKSFPEALRAFAAALERTEELSSEVAELEATNRKLSPKAARADQYEANPGITPTVFHKTWFPSVGERGFFEHLYRKDYLIDQRNIRWNERKEEWQDGPEHRHPTAKGKRYFYLQPTLDRAGVRRQQTLVIPGDAEHDLVAALERDGLPSLDRPAIPGADVIPMPRQIRGGVS